MAVVAFFWLAIYAVKEMRHSFAAASRRGPACAACDSSGGPLMQQQQQLQQLQQLQQQQQLQQISQYNPIAAPFQPYFLSLGPEQQQLEYERQVMRQQILRGTARSLLLQTLERQEAIQRELAFFFNAEQQQQLQQPQQQHLEQQQFESCEQCMHSSGKRSSKSGFLRALLKSFVFKFLLVLWVGYAFVVGCMYTWRDSFFVQQLQQWKGVILEGV